MSRVIPVVLIVATCVLTGCQPDIQRFNPDPVRRGQIAEVEGIRMTGATMSINGTPVGSAFLLATSDPMNRRDIMIPSDAAASISVGASDPAGSDTQNANVDPAPASAAAPPLNFTIAALRNPITGAVTVTATGTGIFPGAGPATGMFEGPQAFMMPGNIPADRRRFISDGEYLFRFNTLAAGNYQLRIENAAFYGGASGPSNNTVAVP